MQPREEIPAPVRKARPKKEEEPPEDPADIEARETAKKALTRVKNEIQRKTEQIINATPTELVALTQELQRLRVAMLMLREIVEDVADPNAYRELHLLNKMNEGADAEGESLRRDQLLAEEEAQQRLESVGASPESAGGLLRALKALESVMSRRSSEDDASADPAA